MRADGGNEERVGPGRAFATGVALLLLIVLAGAGVRQATRLNGSGGGAGAGRLDVRTGRDPAAVDSADRLPPAVDGAWARVPRPNLRGRSDPVAVWTGREVFVWGGWEREETTRTFHDGALYDPVTGGWNPVTAGPPQRWQDGVVGVWTGTEILVVGGRNDIGRDPVAQAYDPDRRRWRVLSRPPRGDWLWDTAVWTGTRLVVLGASHSSMAPAARYDPVTDRWERGAGATIALRAAVSRAVWLDGQMVVSGAGPGSPRLVLQSFDPLGSAWRRGRGAIPEREWLAAMAADEDRGDVLLAGPVPGGRPGFHAARWNRRDGWRPLPDVPEGLRDARPPRILATPGGPLLWPGGSPPSLLVDGAWRPLPAQPTGKRLGEAVVWTPHGLFVWGGHDERHHADGAVFRPEDVADDGAVIHDAPEVPGTWRPEGGLPMPAADARLFSYPGGQVAVVRRADGVWDVWRRTRTWERVGEVGEVGGDPEPCVLLLGTQVVVWGRDVDAHRRRGRAVDVVTGRARALPEPPLPVGGMHGCAWWRGDAVLVSLMGTGGAAARYDPDTDAWTALPPLPPIGLLTGVPAAGAHDDAPLLVLTDVTLARLDDGEDWELSDTPRNGFASAGPSLRWADERLLVWGGSAARALAGGWSWEASRDRWRQIPPAWFTGVPAGGPEAWSGQRWFVWGAPAAGEPQAAATQGAAWEPGTGRWLRVPPMPGGLAVSAALWDGDLLALTVDGNLWRLSP